MAKFPTLRQDVHNRDLAMVFLQGSGELILAEPALEHRESDLD
jgi:hypothetical protein